MYRRFLVVLVVLVALVPVIAAAADQGTAKGKITINGKAKDLTYAYAWKDGANTTVLLSDAKVDTKALGDHFALTDLARKGAFTGVQATITPKGDVSTGTIYTAAEDGYFDAIGIHKWVKKSVTPSSIEGNLATESGEHHFFKTTFSYAADFKAPIGPAPKK